MLTLAAFWEGETWKQITQVWEYVLINTKPPIRVGNVVLGISFVVLSVIVARIFSVVLIRRIIRRMKIEEGVASAFQSLIYYFLFVLLTLFGLHLAGIPVTSLTVLGGALALGLGFASQAVLSNLISGFVLLLERPIRVGDLIDVDGTYGNVEKIGLRCTRIRTGANIHIIVPNNKLLEGKVLNWTLSDKVVRTQVNVGVIYGSPVDEVTRLLRKATNEHKKIKDHPEPTILFRDFGDDALLFEVHFWIEMRTQMDRWQIESDLRYRIDELFREAGLVIAFPQRDVHLYPAGPLDIRMIGPAPRPEPSRSVTSGED